MQKYGHTRKFAKYLVALVIRQIENFTDLKLIDFLGSDKIGKSLGYEKVTCESTFSKVCERPNPRMFEELIYWILGEKFKGKQITLIAQDSTDIPEYSEKDKDSKVGIRTIPKRRQYQKKKVEFFKGFKLHAITEY